MKPPTKNYMTFSGMARETAKRHHGKKWRLYSDAPLNRLIHDFWLNRFTDDAGESFVVNMGPGSSTMTRGLMWGMLGYVKELIVGDVAEGSSPPWDILARVPIENYDDYGPNTRQLFVSLALPKTEADDWMQEYDENSVSRLNPASGSEKSKANKQPRNLGRPKGTGFYAKADKPLIEEMHTLIKGSAGLSMHRAAGEVADRADGGIEFESKVKRLTKGYKKAYRAMD